MWNDVSTVNITQLLITDNKYKNTHKCAVYLFCAGIPLLCFTKKKPGIPKNLFETIIFVVVINIYSKYCY